MGLTRRGFLVGAGVVTLTAGCSTTVTGSPVADPEAAKRVASSTENPPAAAEARVGVLAYPPYTDSESGGLKGPVPDVARAVLDKLGVGKVTLLRMSSLDQIMVALKAGGIDLAGGLGVQPDNCRAVRFTRPDHVSGTAFAVTAGNPKGLRTYADVAAKSAKLGVMRGTPDQADATAAGVPEAGIVAMPDPNVLLAALRAGWSDCVPFDDISLRYLVARNGDGVEVTPQFMPANRPPFVGAYAFPQDSDLFERFDEELGKLHDSGEWSRIVRPAGFTDDNAPPEDMTTESLCGGR